MAIGQPDWTRAVKLLGEHAGELVNVSVDANGNLFCVFKGDYEGELRTVTLDDEGRLSAFIYDSIDAWGQTSSVGFAELAARLGSTIVYERSGESVIIEDFKHGLARWSKVTAGDGAAMEIVSNRFNSSGYCVKFTTSAFLPRHVSLYKNAKIMPVGNCGSCFHMSYSGLFREFEHIVYFYRTVPSYELRLVLSKEQDKIFIETGDLGIVEVGGLNLGYPATKSFCPIKITVNLSTGKYIKLRINALEWDLSDYNLIPLAGAAYDYMKINYKLLGRPGSNDYIYFDDIIITMSEPD